MNIQDEVNQVIIHELIHAYDECRAANLDWSNCSHHACSEVSTYCILVEFYFCFQIFLSFSMFWFLLIYLSVNHVKQIRAGHLSGDCHYKRELLRGYMKIRGHEQVSFLSVERL